MSGAEWRTSDHSFSSASIITMLLPRTTCHTHCTCVAHALHMRCACIAPALHALRLHCTCAATACALHATSRHCCRGVGGRATAHARRTIGRRGVEPRGGVGWGGWGGGGVGVGGAYVARTTMPILLFSVGETCRSSEEDQG